MATKVFTYDSVTGVRTGEDFPRRNAIINGAAFVNQRGTAYTLVKDTYGICADRFYGMATGTAVSAGTFTKDTTASVRDSHSNFYFAGVTLTGTGVIYFRHRIEAKDSLQFVNKTASFRCYAYQGTGGAINYTVYVRKANAADNFAAVTAISDSGAISVSNLTSTSLPYLAIAMGDCSNGIEIEIKVECGAITTKDFLFTECQLELSSVATPFEYRPYGTELALCQRYYKGDCSFDVRFPAQANSTSYSFPYTFTTMRADPTLAFTAAASASANVTGTPTITIPVAGKSVCRMALVATTAGVDTYYVRNFELAAEL